jgi:hypothetical protein
VHEDGKRRSASGNRASVQDARISVACDPSRLSFGWIAIYTVASQPREALIGLATVAAGAPILVLAPRASVRLRF